MEVSRAETKVTIAIDGPAGAGKSTVARLVAQRLGYTYIDTGAMYRAIALKAALCGIAASSSAGWDDLLQNTHLDIQPGAPGSGAPNRVMLDGEDVTDRIRAPEISALVSQIAQHESVRRHLVERQRQMAAQGGVVLDGRDIGTVVLPQAECKFFLTASAKERSKRREAELLRRGYQVDLTEIERDIMKRDEIDSTRAISPLRVPADAVVVDTTGRSIDDVVRTVLDVCRTRVSDVKRSW